MRKNKLSKFSRQKLVVLVVIVITIALVTGFVYFLANKASYLTFFNDYLSNAFATFIGVLVGVLSGLWLTEFQDKETEVKRKRKIISLLNKELLSNNNVLTEWKTYKGRKLLFSTKALPGKLQTESWQAFKYGGELEWIRDPETLSLLSEAYGAIESVKYFAINWSDIVAELDINPSPNEGEGEKNVIQTVGSGVDCALEIIDKTFKLVNGMNTGSSEQNNFVAME